MECLEYFDIEVVRDTNEWRNRVPTGRVAALGDSPALADVYGTRRVNPSLLTHRVTRSQCTAGRRWHRDFSTFPTSIRMHRAAAA